MDNCAINSNAVAQIGSSWGRGGGIYNSGSLTITNTTFTGNSCNRNACGAAIHNGYSGASGATAVISGSTFTSNNGGEEGAAITNEDTLTLTDTTFSGNSYFGLRNSAGTGTSTNCTWNGDQGGIYNNANLSISDCTVANSSFRGGVSNQMAGILAMQGCTLTANKGGGLSNSFGTATVTNTTISGTIPSQCNAAIADDRGTVTVINSTITGTETDPDDSWWCSTYGISDTNWGGSITLVNSIIANNGDGDCGSTAAISAGADSLDTDGSCNTGSTGDPLLAPLADNGGATWTHALQAGSPAIDAGDDAVCAAAPVNGVDQRGVARSDGRCDIGAYEAP